MMSDSWIQYVIPILVAIVSVIISSFSTYYLTSRHFNKQKRFALEQQCLDGFYGPMLNLIKELQANIQNSEQVSQALNHEWQEICRKQTPPFEDHEKYFEPFQKSLDYETERFYNEDLEILKTMHQLIKTKGHLAFPSTASIFPGFLQYLDRFNRPLPYEVARQLDVSAEPMHRLSLDVEKNVNDLKLKLSGQ